ncbi:MAG TPA: two-component regulator propeller domain-containing protein [Rhodothermales bacterium]|nr:two-component regulator propeller domain-containing protein [Rhodothermales bacterium]
MASRRSNNTNLIAILVMLLGASLSFLAFQPVNGQDLARWQSHTPFRTVHALAASDEAVWAATSGGVFSYRLEDGAIETYTTASGLYGIDARAIAFDETRDAVWVGYGDGVLDRIDVATRTVSTFLDIRRADQFSARGINRMRVFGDTVYVATDFGLVLFDPVRLEVRDSFSKLGSLSSGARANDVLTAPSPNGDMQIWVATLEGLARAPITAVNLREPAVWTIEDNLPQNDVRSLASFAGSVLAGTVLDAYFLGSSLEWLKLGVAGDPVTDLQRWGNFAVAVEPFSIVIVDDQLQISRVFVAYGDGSEEVPYVRPSSVVADVSGKLWLADRVEGLLGLEGIQNTPGNFVSSDRVLPDGPLFGLFTDLVVDREGALWASGTSGTGTGFYRLADGQWSSFADRFVPELEGRNTYDFIHADDDGSVWVGSEGFGAARVGEDDAVEVFVENNSSLRAAPGTNGYIRVRGIGSENDGTVWMINEFVGTPLNGRLADGTWFALPALRGDGLPSAISYNRIFVDGFDQKWILPLRSEGLIVWSTSNTPDDPTDDRLKFLRGRGSGGRGLPSENVRAWAEDRSGRVWIGTERGIAVFFIPSLVISHDPNAFEPVWPIAEDRSGFLLRDLFVNDIAVDAADQKWIASTTGAWLIDSEGTVVLEHFTADNSPLFSNEVVAVAVNNRDGRVYFATDRGLLSFEGDPVEPATDADDLFIFPNPVRANGDGSLPPVFIEGLVAETDVRITTADGTLVARLAGRGGRVRWDGRDLNGEYVPSGVYLVIGLGLNDEGAGVGKVAIVR